MNRMKGMFRDLRVVLIAVAVSLLLTGAPAMASAAYDAVNSDSVDGHDAVSAGTRPAKRAHSVIAANKAGYLPNNVIRKAPNSAKLGGAIRADFIQRTSDIDELQTGTWAVSGSAASKSAGAIRFLEDLHSAIAGADTYFIAPGDSTVQCPGEGMVVAQGVLCIYITQESNLDTLHARDASTGSFGASTQGSVVLATFTADGFAYGTWAVRSGE